MAERTFDVTRNCAGCRFWSEMIARAEGGGPVEAMCLNPASRQRGNYVAGFQECLHWTEGGLGAVDQPGGDPYDIALRT